MCATFRMCINLHVVYTLFAHQPAESIVESAEPIVESAEPIVESAELIVESAEPIVESAKTDSRIESKRDHVGCRINHRVQK
jgi:hypothetical protein